MHDLLQDLFKPLYHQLGPGQRLRAVDPPLSAPPLWDLMVTSREALTIFCSLLFITCSGMQPNPGSVPNPPSGGDSAPSSGSTPSGGSAPSGANPTPSAGGGVTPELFQQMLAQVQAGGMGGGAGGMGGGGASVPPATQQQQQVVQLQQAETLYQSQLEQLQMMGFHNRQANLNGKLLLSAVTN